jgi:hypothetical protein
VQHVATWSRESRLGMGDLQTPATYDGSLVMRRGQRFESARRLSFSIDLQEKWTKLRTSRFRSPCPLTPLAPVVPWLVVKQTHVGPTRNSLRDPRADTAKGELHGTASISCERHSVRYVAPGVVAAFGLADRVVGAQGAQAFRDRSRSSIRRLPSATNARGPRNP